MGKSNKNDKMDLAKAEQVGQMLMRLDRFALETSLTRPWHAEWQTLFRAVQADIQEILAQKDPEDARTP